VEVSWSREEAEKWWRAMEKKRGGEDGGRR
jgi:hypothetical protein